MSVAFDTVDHALLLCKLEAIIAENLLESNVYFDVIYWLFDTMF